MDKDKAPKKKRPGPKPKLITLHPFTFDEVLDTVLASKPKKTKQGQNEKILDETTPTNKDNSA